MKPEAIEYLKKLAQNKTWNDIMRAESDTCIDDFAAGNIDDAYTGGEDTGETRVARYVLKELKIPFTIEEE